MIVLDTNVLSEGWRPVPSPRVGAWMRSQPRDALFTTAITEAELLYGLALLPNGRRKKALEQAAAEALAVDLAGRVLPFDSPAARYYAQIMATRRRAGRPMAEADARIAAIALSRGAILATRNVADFQDCGVEVVSPWET